jgi:hypothetical protein
MNYRGYTIEEIGSDDRVSYDIFNPNGNYRATIPYSLERKTMG